MILKSLKLKNIRSYVDQELYFPEGSILLSGDIGAGKTTILLAIEFALFGLIKGDMTGATLLRHGAREGSVTLCFKVEKKEVKITRSLKKTSTSVSQASGSITINGVAKDATAIELKSAVLEVLGYPDSLLTKSKSLLYRFTVYTPQEAMKAILFEDADIRLDTLRKLFGMDTYKRMQEHCSIYLKHIRDQQKTFFGTMQGLDEQEQLLKQRAKEIERIKKHMSEKEPGLNKVQLKLEKQQEVIDSLAKKQEEYYDTQMQFARCEEKLAALLQQRAQRKERIEYLQEIIQTTKKTAASTQLSQEYKNPEIIEKEILQIDQEVQNTLNSLQEYQEHLGSHQAKLYSAQEMVNQVQKINNCPVCYQEVHNEHKTRVVDKQQCIIEECTRQVEKIKNEIVQLKEKNIVQKKTVEEKRKMLQFSAAQKIQLQELQQKQDECERLEKELLLDQKKVANINTEKLQLQTIIFNGKKTQEEHILCKAEIEKLQQEKQTILLELTSLKESANLKEQFLIEQQKELTKKRDAQKQYLKSKQLHHWFTSFFLPLIENMEKHILSKIYHEFNHCFQTWFSLLVEDELLQTRLDATFTPVISQNGYESEIHNLSGGEKTSCALAYRLSLNKVVNSLVSTVKTKDIIILDEPTDGFSAHQIEKLGDVLDELAMHQVIMVSHEAKIESFVDHVIKVEKRDHESVIY